VDRLSDRLSTLALRAARIMGWPLRYGPRAAVHHATYGFHSDIPWCCIWAFVRGRTVDGRTQNNYAPCDRCAEEIARGVREPALVHECDAGESRWCRWISPVWNQHCGRCGLWIDPHDPELWTNVAEWCQPCAIEDGWWYDVHDPLGPDWRASTGMTPDRVGGRPARSLVKTA
jgi:hypothetical protein